MENKLFTGHAQGKELAALPASTINIAVISPNQTQRLQERVAAFHGLVRVFIHPFYERYGKTQCFQEYIHNNQYPKIGIIEKGMARILSLPPEITPPVFVFEEWNNLHETALTIAGMNQNSGNEIYFVPTQVNRSEPKFTREYVDDVECGNWTRLSEYFRKLNVDTVLIGGMRLTISNIEDPQILEDSWTAFRRFLIQYGAVNAKFSIDRCVGQAISRLSKWFKVEVSSLTHPHSRIDISRLSINNEIDRYATPAEDLLHILDYGIGRRGSSKLRKNPFQKK